ncbi:MICAL-like protein 1 [Brachypodium distachyon]|uniref:MICAL-like protein 1 n=1 Tax=Brachypodium distachyon TaxID=15368 RepID=UPI000D0CEFCC|nr:MICAL-like protein 1 [Brachypodium distachyon]|eukprot:XP_024312960.1 MICAL-like protein 1 [Brachypodium distachyon]
MPRSPAPNPHATRSSPPQPPEAPSPGLGFAPLPPSAHLCPTPPSDPTTSIPFRPFSFATSLTTLSPRPSSKMPPPRCSPWPRENCRLIKPPRSSSRPRGPSLPPYQRRGNAPPSISCGIRSLPRSQTPLASSPSRETLAVDGKMRRRCMVRRRAWCNMEIITVLVAVVFPDSDCPGNFQNNIWYIDPKNLSISNGCWSGRGGSSKVVFAAPLPPTPASRLHQQGDQDDPNIATPWLSSASTCWSGAGNNGGFAAALDAVSGNSPSAAASSTR